MLHALDFAMPVLSLPKWLHQGYMADWGRSMSRCLEGFTQ